MGRGICFCIFFAWESDSFFVEICFIQKYILFIGYPVYAVAAILSSSSNCRRSRKLLQRTLEEKSFISFEDGSRRTSNNHFDSNSFYTDIVQTIPVCAI